MKKKKCFKKSRKIPIYSFTNGGSLYICLKPLKILEYTIIYSIMTPTQSPPVFKQR